MNENYIKDCNYNYSNREMIENEKVSVIMGVYNEEDYIVESIESILNQTYSNWELIICDDASEDNTYNILLSYKERYPDKIKVIRNEKNSSLAYSLNRCLKKSTGKYIARMDADDVSIKDRLEKQVYFLKKHKKVDLVGSSMQRFNSKGLHDVVDVEKFPDKYSMKNGSPFNHATILTYHYVYEHLRGYKVSNLTQRVEDQDLFYRFFYLEFVGANISEPLYLVREDSDAIRRRTVRSRYASLIVSLKGYKLLGFPKKWYLRTTVRTIIKSLVPSCLQLWYRNYQSYKYKVKH